MGLLALSGCQQRQVKSVDDSVHPIRTPHIRHPSVLVDSTTENGIMTYTVRLSFENGLAITAAYECIADSHFLYTCYYVCGNQGVLSQRLTFWKGDSVIASFAPVTPAGDSLSIPFGRGKVRVSSWVYCSLSWRPRPKGLLFLLNGSQLSNGGREVSCYYSCDGEFLGLLDCGRRECDSLGDIEGVERAYDIYEGMGFDGVTLFPPQLAGQRE
jgi:hypothetical protein